MNLQQGGKSKSSKTSKSKKGGNFLGSVSELFVPTGWENFATAAGLLAIDRADAAFRRSRNSSKKQKGGADIDGHESIENLENSMQELDTDSTDLEGPQQMNGGGRKTTKKSKTTNGKKPAAKKATKSKKQRGGADIDGHESIENMENLMQELDTDLEGPQQMSGGGRKPTKKSKTTKTTKEKKPAAKKATKSTKKGGNFLGAVGELVAPTGWENFATTAGLFALNRADAALRRTTTKKKEKMNGGNTICTKKFKYTPDGKEYTVCCTTNEQTKCETRTFKNSQMKNDEIYKLIEESIKRKLNKNIINT